MKKVFFTFITCCVLLFVLHSCIRNQPDYLEQALSIAGANSVELEKVLQHYKKEPLKLKAARYLIENMTAHYSYIDENAFLAYYGEIDSLYEATSQLPHDTRLHLYDSISEQYTGIVKYNTATDLKTIKAKFLIDNIDRSFDLWQSGEWATHVGFDDFCEYLLPYKVIEGQTFDNWKEYAYDVCKRDIDSLHYCSTFKHLAFKACERVNAELKTKLNPAIIINKSNLSIKKVDVAMKTLKGTCDQYSFIATAVMRAKGIPVTIDFTPQWPFRSLGHSWNVLLDNFGKNLAFSGCMEGPGTALKVDEKMAKVFRRTYAVNRELEEVLHREKVLPPLLNDLCMKDVTHEYMKTHDVQIKIKAKTKHKYAYLAVFNNQVWTPIYWGQIKGNKVTFERMGSNIVYLPVCFENSGIVPIGSPFLLTYSGEKKDIVANDHEKQRLKLYRKYLFPQHAYKYYKSTIGGKIQAATYTDFRDSVTLFTIREPGINTGKITFKEKKFQYWRYVSPGKTSCNMAELFFFAKGNPKPVYGDIIGTKDSMNIIGRNKESVFDGDPLTFFESPPDLNTWVGLDFGKPVEIEKILYIARGDGNSIVFGNDYELMYWNHNGWISLGKQTADNNFLEYKDCPTGALFLLQNHTIGKDERIFTYKNGEQIWW
ncbi:MAG: hypothetical protein VB046_00915 [Paludibacter sp.]|nr:hypothetical protein [Paludibacter sp.]